MLMSKKPGKIGGTLLLCLTRPLALLPLGFHRACGRVLGRFIGKVVRYRRDVVMINLAKSFPEKRYDELAALCDRFYEHLGTIIGEALWFGGCTDAARLRRSHIVEIENPELLNRFFAQGRSVCTMYSHNGNWELIGGYVSYAYGEPLQIAENDICVIYRKLSNAAWDYFMGINRTAPLADRSNYEGMVETFSALRFILKHRDRTMLYNFITDQFPYSASSCVPVGDFLGQKTLSMDGAVTLAHRLSLPLLYMGMEVKEDGNYLIRYSIIAEDASQHDPGEMLRKYYDLLEADIRKQPWNYLWTHKRWK